MDDRQMVGLLIAIYATLLALLGWLVHMLRGIGHPKLRRRVGAERR